MNTIKDFLMPGLIADAKCFMDIDPKRAARKINRMLEGIFVDPDIDRPYIEKIYIAINPASSPDTIKRLCDNYFNSLSDKNKSKSDFEIQFMEHVVGRELRDFLFNSLYEEDSIEFRSLSKLLDYKFQDPEMNRFTMKLGEALNGAIYNILCCHGGKLHLDHEDLVRPLIRKKIFEYFTKNHKFPSRRKLALDFNVSEDFVRTILNHSKKLLGC